MKPAHFPHLAAAARSEPGLKRRNNEDSFGAFPAAGVWCVADGMGGGDDGEIASAEVVQKVEDFCRSHPFPDGECLSGESVAEGVVEAVNAASSWIFARAARKKLNGCGSTFVAAVFDASRPDRAIALHAGDSRLYRVRGRDIKQITKDHSAAELVGAKRESDLNPMFRGMILRAVGIQNLVEVERTPFAVKKGDAIVICSDGLSKMVPDSRIAAIVSKAGEDVKAAADALIDAAYKAGASDNVTVEVVKAGEIPPPMRVAETVGLSGAGDGDGETVGEEAAQFDSTCAGGSEDEGNTAGTEIFCEATDDAPAVKDAAPEHPEPPPARRAPPPAMIWLGGLLAGLLGGAVVAAAIMASMPHGADAPRKESSHQNAAETAAVSAVPAVAPVSAARQPPLPPKSAVPQPAAARRTPVEPVPAAPAASETAVSAAMPKQISPEEAERASLEAQLKRERERVRRDETAVAMAAARDHEAAAALGAVCRRASTVSIFADAVEKCGVSCASMRSCAHKLASLKPGSDGVDSAACDLVRELQKLSVSSNEGVRAIFKRMRTAGFSEMDPMSAEAYGIAARVMEGCARRKGGDG